MRTTIIAGMLGLAGCSAATPDPRLVALEDRALLDVNGQVARSREEIEAIYKDTAERTGDRKGTFRMVLSNLQVAVDGNRATARMIWTGVHSESVTAPPQLNEQGTEEDELVKVEGRWLFSKRIVTSDGGMPESLLPAYLRRTQR